MPRFLEHARALADALRPLPGLAVVPDSPQTPLFHLHVRGDVEGLRERAFEIAEERRVWLTDGIAATVVPGVSRVELSIGEPALEVSPEEAAELFSVLLSV
jgi:hypothetical protein